MPPDETNETARPEAGWRALTRFLPYLWPAGHPKLKARVILALLLVFMFGIRPIIRDTLKSLPGAKAAPELQAAQGLPGQLPRTIEEVEGEIEAQLDAAVAARVADRKMPVLQRRVLTMAQGEPQNAARLMRSWLSEGRNG